MIVMDRATFIVVFFPLIFPGVKHSSKDSECGEVDFTAAEDY